MTTCTTKSELKQLIKEVLREELFNNSKKHFTESTAKNTDMELCSNCGKAVGSSGKINTFGEYFCLNCWLDYQKTDKFQADLFTLIAYGIVDLPYEDFYEKTERMTRAWNKYKSQMRYKYPDLDLSNIADKFDIRVNEFLGIEGLL
jgi:hypothetical protein